MDPAVHDIIKPLSWLLGKWRSEDAQGHYPTIDDFKYIEEVEFFQVGQPNIQFSFYSFHAETKKPLHREVGFIRITPDAKKVALICASNIGLTEISEGVYNDAEQEMCLESQGDIGRMSFCKPPMTKKIVRTFCRHGDQLEQVVDMETANTPLTNHLRVKYNNVH